MLGLSRGAIPALLIAVSVLTGCGERPAAKSSAGSAASDAVQVTDGASAAPGCLVAGAEAFETLTERAISAPSAQLEAEARRGASQARACEADLSPSQFSALQPIIQRIGEFPQTHDRSQLALNAVEGYRVLVSAQARSASDTPLAVALLDYAGFRYRADVLAAPPRWDDARQAVDFADAQWRTLAPQLSDAALKAAFDADIRALRGAVSAADVAAAERAANVELERVDALEQYFARHSGG